MKRVPGRLKRFARTLDEMALQLDEVHQMLKFQNAGESKYMNVKDARNHIWAAKDYLGEALRHFKE